MNRKWLLVQGLLMMIVAGSSAARLAHSDEPPPSAASAAEGDTVASSQENLAVNSVVPADEANPETETLTGAQPPSPDGVPVDRITWIGSISGTFQELCLPCHPWSDSYAEVAQRVQSQQMQVYLDIDHFITGPDKEVVQTWIAGGYPEQ